MQSNSNDVVRHCPMTKGRCPGDRRCAWWDYRQCAIVTAAVALKFGPRPPSDRPRVERWQNGYQLQPQPEQPQPEQPQLEQQPRDQDTPF